MCEHGPANHDFCPRCNVAAEAESLRAEVRRLRQLFGDAVGVIENYRLDIREQGLDEEGFCQGTIYLRLGDKLIAARDEMGL